MKPQSSVFLGKARELLGREPALLAKGFPDEAGRAAYLAGFHAAQALIFEREDRVLKTHKGVQSEFGRLARDEPHFDVELRAFRGRAYNLKAIVDYEFGPESKVSNAQASEAINAARRFADAISKCLGSLEP